MIKIPKIPEGSKMVDNIALSPEEVQFYQLMAEDKTVIDAAELSLQVKRTCEDRMYRLKDALNIRTNHGLIAYLIKNKIIKP